MQKTSASSYSLSKEIVKLEQLRQEGILSQDEFERGKENLLQGVRVNQEMQNRLAQVEVQNRLTELDRAWKSEREKYMMRNKLGYKFEPSMNNVIGIPLVLFIFGLLMLLVGINPSKDGSDVNIQPISLLIAMGIIVGSIYTFFTLKNKIEKYQIEKANYEKKRANIKSIQNELR
jgi:hypothetical protein